MASWDNLLLVLSNLGLDMAAETKWVFGYGSLCWLPGFDFDTSVAGHVRGFARHGCQMAIAGF